MSDRPRVPELASFLTVGGLAYVVDTLAFNVLRSVPPTSLIDPIVAKVLAVGIAMVVTYLGNRWVTWRHTSGGSRRRDVVLFILFNVIGLGFSVVTLAISHDLLGLTSRLADNISANVIGVGLGTVFRFVMYRRFVFGAPAAGAIHEPDEALIVLSSSAVQAGSHEESTSR